MSELKTHTFKIKEGVYVPMPSQTFKIYYPLAPLSIHEDDFNEYVTRCINELVGLSEQLEFTTISEFSFKPKIYITKDYKAKSWGMYYEYLVFENDFPVDYPQRKYQFHASYLPKEGIPMYEEERRSLVLASNTDIFTQEMQMLLVRTLLAKPGYLGTFESELTIDDKYYGRTFAIKNLLRVHRKTPLKMDWPYLNELPILQVEEWFKKHRYTFNCFSKSKTERALNAYTYLVDNYSITAHNLFWSMVGIESLYCKGTSELADQLNIKIQLLLGSAPSLNKTIRNLYSFRSRFVHGDLDIPSIYINLDTEKAEENKYSQEIETNVPLAVSILTATLQELIKRDISNLNFEFRIADKP